MSQSTADTSPDLVVATLAVAPARLGSPLALVGGPFRDSRGTPVVRASDGQGGTIVVKRYLWTATSSGCATAVAELHRAAAGLALPEGADAAGRLARAVGTRYAASDVPFAPASSGGAFR